MTVARTYSGTFSRIPLSPPLLSHSLSSSPADDLLVGMIPTMWVYTEGTAAVSFLDSFISKFDSASTLEPFVLVTMERAHFKLLLGEAEETKEAMDRCEKVLNGLDSVELGVHASFYRVSGDYWKVRSHSPCSFSCLVFCGDCTEYDD